DGALRPVSGRGGHHLAEGAASPPPGERRTAMTESRRADIVSAIQAETGIDEAMIQALVHGFYDRVRRDDLLGPVFEAHVDDWTPHLERMCEFWSSVALMSGRYHGRPMPKHLPLP